MLMVHKFSPNFQFLIILHQTKFMSNSISWILKMALSARNSFPLCNRRKDRAIKRVRDGMN